MLSNIIKLSVKSIVYPSFQCQYRYQHYDTDIIRYSPNYRYDHIPFVCLKVLPYNLTDFNSKVHLLLTGPVSP